MPQRGSKNKGKEVYLMSEEAYRDYLEHGPSVGIGVLRAALTFQDAHPVEALRIKRSHEQAKREAEAIDLFESTAMAHGASATEAREQALEHVRSERTAATEQDIEQSKRDAWTRTRGVF